MKDAKALLDTLMQRGGEAAAKARETWDAQSTGTKGALAGGLLGVLFGGGRGGLGSVARVGGMAAIGSLAARALADWQASRDAPAEAEALGDDAEAEDEVSTRVLRAMVAVAKADGRVTDAEHARISAQLSTLDLGPEASAMLEAELAAPLDVDAVAALARNPREAAGLYAASLLVAQEGGPAETQYLSALAERLKLDPALVAQLQARVAQLG